MAAKFSRSEPSPRYRRLLQQYELMHLHGERDRGIAPEDTFPGRSLPKEAPRIKRLIKLTGARTILDYGAGKGQQYLPLRIADEEERIEYPDIRSFWGVEQIRCYDPAYQPFLPRSSSTPTWPAFRRASGSPAAATRIAPSSRSSGGRRSSSARRAPGHMSAMNSASPIARASRSRQSCWSASRRDTRFGS